MPNDAQSIPEPQERKEAVKMAVPVVSDTPAILRGRGQVQANGLHAKRDPTRLAIATDLVMAGKTIPQAMRAAGYSPNTAKQSNQYPVKQRLIKARDTYLVKYVKSIRKLNLDGESTAKRLAAVVHGKDDYNAIQAIKTHVMILLKNAPNSDQSGSFFGVFMVPASKPLETWENDAQTLQRVAVRDIIQEAETVPS